MPPFGSLSPQQNAILVMSHAMSTYAVMDDARVRAGEVSREEAVQRHGERDIDLLEQTGWIETVDGKLSITEAGYEHLRKF